MGRGDLTPKILCAWRGSQGGLGTPQNFGWGQGALGSPEILGREGRYLIPPKILGAWLCRGALGVPPNLPKPFVVQEQTQETLGGGGSMCKLIPLLTPPGPYSPPVGPPAWDQCRLLVPPVKGYQNPTKPLKTREETSAGEEGQEQSDPLAAAALLWGGEGSGGRQLGVSPLA